MHDAINQHLIFRRIPFAVANIRISSLLWPKALKISAIFVALKFAEAYYVRHCGIWLDMYDILVCHRVTNVLCVVLRGIKIVNIKVVWVTLHLPKCAYVVSSNVELSLPETAFQKTDHTSEALRWWLLTKSKKAAPPLIQK